MDQPLRAWAGLTTEGLSTRPVFLVQSLARCGSWRYRDGSMPPRDQQVSCEIHVRQTIESAARLSWVFPSIQSTSTREAARLNASACFSPIAIYRNSRSRTGRFASSLDRTDASDASTLENGRSIGIVDEATWPTVYPIVVELVHACYRDTAGTNAHVTSSRVCLARVLHAVVNAVKNQQLQIQESVSTCAIIADLILSRCYKLRWFHGI